MDDVIPLPYTGDGRNSRDYVKEKPKRTYTQNWPAYNRAQVNERFMFLKILSEATDSIGIRTYGKKNGRPPLDLADMIKCCIIRTYYGFSIRKVIPEIKIAHILRYINRVPHYNSMISYMNSNHMNRFLHELVSITSTPLSPYETKFAADATGFSTSNRDKWVRVRLEHQKHHSYKKLHAMCGVNTHVIVSAKITEGNAADSPQFKEMLHRIANDYKIKEVSADPAYLSRENVQAIEDIGAKPFIKLKSNIRTKNKGCPAWGRMIRYCQDHQAVFMAHYHKRSNIESTFSMMKRKYGDYVRNKTNTSQENEILCKVICHNISCLISAVYELNLDLELLR